MEQGGIQNQANAVLPANRRDFAHVLQGERLTANQVGARFNAHEGDVVNADFLNECLQARDVEVALKGAVVDWLESLLNDQLLDAPAQAGDVRFRGGEVEVHGHHVAGLNECRSEDIFCSAPLVDGEEVVKAENFANLGGHAVVGFRTGVGVIGAQHGRLLEVAHGVHARIGEHIHEDVAILKKEGVIPRFVHLACTLLHGREKKLLDNAHLVHLKRKRFATVERNVSHWRNPYKLVVALKR